MSEGQTWDAGYEKGWTDGKRRGEAALRGQEHDCSPAEHPLCYEVEQLRSTLLAIRDAPLPHQEVKVGGRWITLAQALASQALGPPTREELVGPAKDYSDKGGFPPGENGVTSEWNTP